MNEVFTVCGLSFLCVPLDLGHCSTVGYAVQKRAKRRWTLHFNHPFPEDSGKLADVILFLSARMDDRPEWKSK